MNMQEWMRSIINGEKKPLPVLTFPSVQELGVSVRELVGSAELQAAGMEMIARRYAMAAAPAFMDLSIEAEAFGANCVYSDTEVPTITGKLLEDEDDAEALVVPAVGTGRTGVAVETVQKALQRITDRPVLAGCIGPFSLAGRLVNVNDIMVDCYADPDMVHKVLEKASAFLVAYLKAFKAVGAHGVVMAEPLAGLLSPALMSEFSSAYVKQIREAVEDEGFLVVYHNCGSAINRLVPEMLETGCRVYHFGEAADMKAMLENIPAECLVMGNISPSAAFNNSSVEKLKSLTTALLERCAGHDNFLISSGCDLPPHTSFSAIDAFFEAAEAFYAKG